MVGGALVAPRGRELRRGLQPSGHAGDRRPAAQGAGDALQIERLGIDGVVRAWIADEAGQVEGLRGPHGARRSDSGAGGGAAEASGVERRRRPHGARLGLVGGDHAHLGGGAGECLLGFLAHVEATANVRGRDVLAAALQLCPDLPVGHRHEGQPFALTLDDEPQGRRLHPADGEKRGTVAIRGEREEAAEHRPPQQIDVLASAGGVCQIEVHGDRLGERGQHVFGDQRRVTDPVMTVHDAGRQHGLDPLFAGLDGDLCRRRRIGGLGFRRLALARRLHLSVLVMTQRLPAQDLQCLVPDELALAVEVGGHDELVGALGGSSKCRQHAG